jgi:hypothetical protein
VWTDPETVLPFERLIDAREQVEDLREFVGGMPMPSSLTDTISASGRLDGDAQLDLSARGRFAAFGSG